MTESALAEKLKDRAATPAKANKDKTVFDLIQSMTPQIAKALPKHLDPERFARLVLTVVRSNPKLQLCTQDSLLAAIMTSAQLGLEPGPLGYVWYIPKYVKEKDINGRDTGRKVWVVQFQIGYQGWLELMDRSGAYSSIVVHEVYDGDEFDYAYGDDERIIHKPNPDTDPDPKKMKYIYAILKLKDKDCDPLRKVMTKKEIDTIMRRSPAYTNGPWVTDYVPMSKKTCIKQIAKYAKKSIEIVHALTADETVKNYNEEEEDMAMLPSIDVDYSIMPDDDPAPDPTPGKKADDPAPSGFITEGSLFEEQGAI